MFHFHQKIIKLVTKIKLRPAFSRLPILHILDWRCYAYTTNEGFSNMTIESEVSVDDKNRFLIELIAQSTKVRPETPRSKFVRPGGTFSGF
jgi:hypothetical protein